MTSVALPRRDAQGGTLSRDDMDAAVTRAVARAVAAGSRVLLHIMDQSKLGGRCPTACVSVMVPNSLGPAELLLHYGTEEQKNYYLPRLAKGLEMPCFALTGPGAHRPLLSLSSDLAGGRDIQDGELTGVDESRSRRGRYFASFMIASAVLFVFSQ